MKNLRQKPSLLRARPLVFSPIYLNAEKISTEKLLALYRFANIFFPRLGPGLVKTILDMEKHGERLTAAVPPEERKRLINEIQGLSVNLQYAIKDGEEKVLEMSVHVVPAEVLERAQQGKGDFIQYHQLQKKLEGFILRLVEQEVRRRFTGKIEGLLREFLRKPHVPGFVRRLFETGWIDHTGRLKKGATIEDLIAGKYRADFERLAPEELLQEGLQIRETIKTCFTAGVDDADAVIQDAKRRYAMLEITIRAARHTGA